MIETPQYEHSKTPPHRYSSDQVSSYHKQIENCLERVERALTHYQVLGADRRSTSREITLAYRKTVTLLNPSYYGVDLPLSEETMTRIDLVFSRVSHAYSVLANVAKRLEYDTLLDPTASSFSAIDRDEPLRHFESASMTGQTREGDRSQDTDGERNAERVIQATIELPSTEAVEEPIAETLAEAADNRRKFDRYPLAIPVYVTGHDRISGEWHEMTQTINVSRTGVTIVMSRKLRHRQMLHLALPLPMKLRCHRHADPSYSIYGLVRRIEPPKDGTRVVAIEFVGEHPPAGFIHKPWVTYNTKWGGGERRREPRSERAETLTIECLDESLNPLRQEVVVTENISAGGARVYLKSAPPHIDLVRVTSLDRSFETLASLCNRYIGRDGFERLCLRFIENKWPL